MKRVLLVLLSLTLAACLPTTTPPPPTPVPVSSPQGATETSMATPPPPDSATVPAPSDTPTNLPSPPDVTSFPAPEAYIWAEVLSGLQRPVDLQHAGDGSGRLFVVEKPGRIRIAQEYQLLDEPFLDITARVGDDGNEQGLLGLAFHPRYAENGLFYVNYTDNNGDTVIARYRVTADPNIADPNSEAVLLNVEQPFGNHNGGVLDFGPDGYLYAGLGDGGSAGDPLGNAQKLDTFLGKILRLDVDNGEPYAIPADNPFGNEIWAYGLRNPWRMSFDISGDLFIGDVGQNQWEEIDVIPAGSPGGQNFGWNILEGTHSYAGVPQDGLVPPVAEYNHQQGCSVTGGYVYRGQMREWWGIYFYGDYCSGKVWGLVNVDGQWQTQVLYETGVLITSFGVDEAGEVYIVTDKGQVLRLIPR